MIMSYGTMRSVCYRCGYLGSARQANALASASLARGAGKRPERPGVRDVNKSIPTTPPAKFSSSQSSQYGDHFTSSITRDLNPSQKEAVLQPRYSITRVIAGPGSGKTKVLTCRINYLLQVNNAEGVLALTFTKKSADDMKEKVHKVLESGPSLQRPEVGTFHSVCSKILRRFGNKLAHLPSILRLFGSKNAAGATITQAGLNDALFANCFVSNKFNENNNISIDGSFSILDRKGQLRLMEKLVRDNIGILPVLLDSSISVTRYNDELFKQSDKILRAVIWLNTKEAATDLRDIGTRTWALAEKLRLPFQKAKYSQNLMDFDDLIVLTRELLLSFPAVREQLHFRWRHVLVDEFQDTSQLQIDVVRLLTTNSLFVAGDADQAIYSWRGAKPESMSEIEILFHNRPHGWEGLVTLIDTNLSQYIARIGGGQDKEMNSNLKVESVFLMENYRSTTNIVKAAQRIISESEICGLENTISFQDSIRRDMKSMRGTGPNLRVLKCTDSRAEANFVVTTVNSMIESGEITPVSTVAFIFRTNAKSCLLEEACVAHNLRYVVRGSAGKFYHRAEVQDCLSFLKIVYNPRDRTAWARAVKAPSRGIGEASLNDYFRYCDAVTEKYAEINSNINDIPNPLDVLISFADGEGSNSSLGKLVSPTDFLSTRSMKRFVLFASSLRSLRRKAVYQNVSDFISSVVEDLELRSHLESISKSNDEFSDRCNNLDELVQGAKRFDNKGPCLSNDDESALGKFLDDVALMTEKAPKAWETEETSQFTVNLMTIHKSKGLEFDAVFVVGNEDGLFPLQLVGKEGTLPEERRLFYVAMTRAKTHLVFTWACENGRRSRFLDLLVAELGETQVERNECMKRENPIPIACSID